MSAADPSFPPPGAAPLFAALGDATRLALLASLCTCGPCSVARLSRSFTVSRQAITKHLEILSQAGLVQSRRQGRERLWRCEARRLLDAQTWLQRLSRQWDEALGRLKDFVET